MADMREKIVEIVYDCPYRELHTWEKEVVDALLDLFTAETAAMREALQAGADEIWRLRHRSSERPQRTLDVISQMNTALKGGK